LKFTIFFYVTHIYSCGRQQTIFEIFFTILTPLNFLLFNVYFIICFFWKQTTNTYLKLEIRVVCREFLAFKYVVIGNLENSDLNLGFSVHNIHLYLCWQVKDTKRILCCRKIGVNCAYLRFLMYKKNEIFI